MSPYFIITAGATGSGKTGLINKTMEYLNISDQPFVKILVDDLVENDVNYKNKVKKIIDNVSSYCVMDDNKLSNKGKKLIKQNCETNAYNNPDEQLYKQFSDAYFTTRKANGCINNCENLTCDELNDKNIKDATSQSKNIVFEFTGGYIPDWLLNPSWIPEQYTIVITYSLVTLANLVNRNKSRAYTALQAFDKDFRLPAPRLPNVSYDTFKKTVTSIYDVLCNIYELCVLNYDKVKCGERQINQLLLFDNNGKSLVNIFDSNKNKIQKPEFINMISDSFGLMDNKEGGYRKKSKGGYRKKSKNFKRSVRNNY